MTDNNDNNDQIKKRPASTRTTATPTQRTAPSKPSATQAKPTSTPTRTSATSTRTATTPSQRVNATPAPKQSAATSARTSATQAKPTSTSTRTSATPTRTETTPTRTTASTPAQRVSADTASKESETVRKANTTATPKKSDAPKAKKARGAGAAAATASDDRKKKIVMISIIVACALAMIGIIIGIVFGVRSCNRPSDFNPVAEINRYDSDAHKTSTTVGYYGKVNGTVAPNKPVSEVRNESEIFGNEVYPQYGKTPSNMTGDANTNKRNSLIREASYLTASGTRNAGGGGYKWMDENGYLYTGTTTDPIKVYYQNTTTQRQLYKHTASVGLYGGDVSDNEPRISKTVRLRPRGYGSYSVTGLYAPAGEVIKIELSEADMNATSGVDIHIGQALYNGKANNIWATKNQMQRFPVLLNTLTVDKTTSYYDETTKTYTAYVGSFLGGPIYIRNESVTFTATISGGVAYSHFILGYTTEKEFEENAKSSAPYFDLEVWNFGVLHSGPARQAKKFSYEDLYNVAILWDKVASVSTTNSNQGIVFIYDPFVAAGAAVAFPGQMSVNCPEGWMASSLDYKQIISTGSWGNFHEYHHNFQNYGVGDGGEVTNNGMTLVSYSLFTKISERRGISNFGAQGLGGWNDYTSAPWAIEQTLKIARPNENPSNGNKGLALYATLLHSFGPDAYIQAKVKQQRGGYGQTYSGYMRAWEEITHNNMSYYFNDILGGGVSASAAAKDYPMFVPVATTYQTGRSYMYDGEKKYISTMQPYVIPFGDPFTVDLRKYTAPNGQYEAGSVVIPDGFSYKIKNFTQPENGKFEKTDVEGVYTYIPDKSSKDLLSGKICVTLEITKSDGAFSVADVDLVLEFKQSHESNKMNLERTTYYYDGEKYKDAEAAYNANFAGYTDKKEIVHTNPTQNCNTDIWYYIDTPDNREKYKDAPDHYFVKENTVAVVDGKLFIEEEGKYRIYLRGRLNCALYYSTDQGDNKQYKLGATIKDQNASTSTANFRPNDPNTYFDVEVAEPKSWIYIKEVMIGCIVDSGRASFIGVGMQQWTKPLFTIRDFFYDKNGNAVSSADDPNYHHTVTKYYNYMGVEVSEEVANKAEPIEPKITSQPYVNAYRASYESVTDDFTSDYMYRRAYTYNYNDNNWLNETQTLVHTNYEASNSWNYSQYKSENLTDGDKNTIIHTKVKATPDKPFEFVIDMGEAKSVNRMIVYTQNRGGNGDWLCPRKMTLEGSLDGNEYFPVSEIQNDVRATKMTFNFDEKTFRYYKLTVTESDRLLIIAEIEMWHVVEVNGGAHYSPDDKMFEYSETGWHGAATESTFGHVIVGNKNATVKFKFTGTRIGILSSSAYGRNFEVYIDGKKVDSVPLKDDPSAYAMTYLCDKLESGEHTVEIKCTADVANIDSIVIYNEQ